MGKKISVAYHTAQKSLVSRLKEVFKNTSVEFVSHEVDESTSNFYETLRNTTSPILFLISDNFLKSTNAMLGAMSFMQEYISKNNFKVMVVPGNDISGKTIPTKFDKISTIIHYINYWQDEYLSARQAGRRAGGLTADMDQLIKDNRSISTQIGEYLRFLRDHNLWSFDNQNQDGFQDVLVYYGINGKVEGTIEHQVGIAETEISVEEITDSEEVVVEEIEDIEDITEDITEEITEELPVIEMAKAEANVVTMDASREEYQEVPAIEADEIAYQSSLDLINDFIDNKDFDSAKILLEELMSSHPNEASVWSRMGLLSEEEGDFLSAGTQYSKALELDPTLPELDYKLGMIISSYHPDQMERAVKHFEKAIQKNPNHADARYQLAVLINEKLENPDEAIPHFEKVLSIAPDHEFANYDLALIYFDKGKMPYAKSYYVQAYQNNSELRTKINDQAFGINEMMPADKVEMEFPKQEATIDEIADENSNEALSTEVTNVGVESEDKIAMKTDVKTVLITGGTSGIGKATADVFIEAGYFVIITGRRAERLADYHAQLDESHKEKLKTLAFDVRDAKACQNALNSLDGEFSQIDILINNAGLASGLDYIHEGDFEDWDRMIDTNIKGLLYMTRLVTPGMVKRKSGHVINVCSTAGHEVYPRGNVYCATKHAVGALTKGMRLDLYEHGIKVSQVSPAMVEETEFSKVRFHGDQERAKIYEDFNPLTSRDVAESIFFIASRPSHVNVQEVLMMGTQQATSTNVDRSGRKYD